jgi:hypothetical protein
MLALLGLRFPGRTVDREADLKQPAFLGKTLEAEILLAG